MARRDEGVEIGTLEFEKRKQLEDVIHIWGFFFMGRKSEDFCDYRFCKNSRFCVP